MHDYLEGFDDGRKSGHIEAVLLALIVLGLCVLLFLLWSTT